MTQSQRLFHDTICHLGCWLLTVINITCLFSLWRLHHYLSKTNTHLVLPGNGPNLVRQGHIGVRTPLHHRSHSCQIYKTMNEIMWHSESLIGAMGMGHPLHNKMDLNWLIRWWCWQNTWAIQQNTHTLNVKTKPKPKSVKAGNQEFKLLNVHMSQMSHVHHFCFHAHLLCKLNFQSYFPVHCVWHGKWAKNIYEHLVLKCYALVHCWMKLWAWPSDQQR